MKSYGDQMMNLLERAVNAAESGDVSAAQSAYSSAESICNSVDGMRVPDGAQEVHGLCLEAFLDYSDAIYEMSEAAKARVSGDEDGYDQYASFAAEDMQSGSANLNKAAPLLDELIQSYK